MNTRRTLLGSALLVLAFGCADVPVEPGAQRQPIVGGTRGSSAADVMATVGLMDPSWNEPFCTGTLVAPDVVVTAAHCVSNPDKYGGFAGTIRPSQVQIVVGEVDLYGAPASSTYDVERVVRHADFPYEEWPRTDDSIARQNDIGVIVLSSPVRGVAAIPVLRPEALDTELTSDRMLRIAGYGTTHASGESAVGALYYGDTPFVRHNDTEMLAGGSGLPDTCPGDSGGPAYVETGDGWRLVGVTSRAPDDYWGRDACGVGAVFTLAPAYLAELETWSGRDLTAPSTPLPADEDAGAPPPEQDSGTAPDEDAGAPPVTLDDGGPVTRTDSGPASTPPSGDDDGGGCGCVTAGKPSPPSPPSPLGLGLALGAIAGLALAVRLRRRVLG